MTMKCKNHIKVGATLTINLQRVSGSVPVSLENIEIESSIRHPKFGTYEMDVEIVDTDTGQVKLTLDSDTTSRITPGEYVWSISFTEPDGTVEIFPKDNSTTLTFNR